MEFLSSPPVIQSKNLYPCLASITIAPVAGGGSGDRSRRLSTGSADGNGQHDSAVADEDDNIIRRVISGNRRKSSFGNTGSHAASGAGGDAAGRRMSIAPSAFTGQGGVTVGNNATGPEGVEKGTWFWRVQAGVVDNNLVLVPLSQPPNPLLTSPPAPLSSAMPAHHSSNKTSDEGLVDKVKGLFRRGSTNAKESATAHADTDGHDKVLDQTPHGDQLPSASANAAGANNLNANAETGWPGVINGEKLQVVLVPLNQIDRSKLKVTGGKRGEASWVTVPVTSHFAHMIQGHVDGANAPKSGVVRLEFDKDWIGSKGEAELLHHHITQAVSSRVPKNTQVQLGQGHSGAAAGGATYDPHTAGSSAIDDGNHATLHQALGYTPDESAASSRKIAG